MSRIFTPFTTNEIKPTGWLKDQLIIQAKGLSGNLDKMWRDVKDSRWIGGDCEGWERVPYWLDGFIPLAYLLEDEDMIARAQKYIDAIIENQCEDGWICPCSKEDRKTYDMWALFLILKVLIVYYDCSKDERVEQVVYDALRNYYEFNSHYTTFGWASTRWYECVISIAWLYARRPEKWLVELATLLQAQGVDYYSLTEFLKKVETSWTFYNHVVNLAMAIKADAVMSLIDNRNSEKRAEKFLSLLTKYHGNVNGYFNGDECLAGTSPIRGTELCGVAEAMYSYEVIAQTTTNTVWMDRCEVLAFNAFPATVSEDMWTHQYLQLSNQPYCVDEKDGKPQYNSNSTQAHLFGLEPHFGCCTANHNQAFPKFTLSCFMKSNDGIAVTSLAPCSLKTNINGVPVTILTDTLYPFRDKVSIKVDCEKAIKFALYIRIPAFFNKAIVNGKEVETGKYLKLEQEFFHDAISIELFASPKFVKRGKLWAVKRGALTYTLPIKERWEMREYEKNGVERKFPYCDYEIYAESEWQYGFANDKLEYCEFNDYKSAFSTEKPLCSVKANLSKIDWGFMQGKTTIASPYPNSIKPLSEPEQIALVPFACAKLRMTELPKCKK